MIYDYKVLLLCFILFLIAGYFALRLYVICYQGWAKGMGVGGGVYSFNFHHEYWVCVYLKSNVLIVQYVFCLKSKTIRIFIRCHETFKVFDHFTDLIPLFRILCIWIIKSIYFISIWSRASPPSGDNNSSNNIIYFIIFKTKFEDGRMAQPFRIRVGPSVRIALIVN